MVHGFGETMRAQESYHNQLSSEHRLEAQSVKEAYAESSPVSHKRPEFTPVISQNRRINNLPSAASTFHTSNKNPASKKDNYDFQDIVQQIRREQHEGQRRTVAEIDF